MARVYYNLVKCGKWAIEDVPDLWRGEVEKMIKQEQE